MSEQLSGARDTLNKMENEHVMFRKDMYLHMFVCVCVCSSERETEEKGRDRRETLLIIDRFLCPLNYWHSDKGPNKRMSSGPDFHQSTPPFPLHTRPSSPTPSYQFQFSYFHHNLFSSLSQLPTADWVLITVSIIRGPSVVGQRDWLTNQMHSLDLFLVSLSHPT